MLFAPKKGGQCCNMPYKWYFLVLRQSSGLLVFLNFKTILGPTSDRHSPQCCKSRILEDLTKNVAISLTIAL